MSRRASGEVSEPRAKIRDILSRPAYQPEEETQGLDLTLHGESAYNNL